jgi:hypothetical protein
MLCADRVPIVRAHFKSAMTQTGSPDPRIDLVCITSSCPRQFLQNFGTPSSLPGLTSFNRSGFDATSLWHFDAAEWAPSTASFTTDAVETTRACTSAVARKRTNRGQSQYVRLVPITTECNAAKKRCYSIASSPAQAVLAGHRDRVPSRLCVSVNSKTPPWGDRGGVSALGTRRKPPSEPRHSDEQARNHKHHSGDEYGQARKQQKVAQEYMHTPAPPYLPCAGPS